MITKSIAILLIFGGIYFFKLGTEYDDSDTYYLMNIKFFGVSILMLILGFGLLFTSK